MLNCPDCHASLQAIATRTSKDFKQIKRRYICRGNGKHRLTTIESFVHTAAGEWQGLWHTNEREIFICVPGGSKQPFIIYLTTGMKGPFVTIDADGYVYRGESKEIKLMEKQRGDEHSTSTGLLWPCVV